MGLVDIQRHIGELPPKSQESFNVGAVTVHRIYAFNDDKYIAEFSGVFLEQFPQMSGVIVPETGKFGFRQYDAVDNRGMDQAVCQYHGVVAGCEGRNQSRVRMISRIEQERPGIVTPAP